MDIFEELGVTAYINANEWYTSQGGSMLAAPVIEAMAAASQRAVRLVELQNAVGDAIARLTQNEAACVTCSATAGIVLAVAALMSGLDPKKSERLPHTRGLKKEVIIHRCDRFGEDAAIGIPGARLIEIGDKSGATEEELREAITPRTAALFTTPPREGMIPLETIVRIAHESGCAVIVDVAWSLPPKEHLWKFTRDLGADVVVVSGGKGLRGPQASGLVLGRKEIVEACKGMMAPHCRLGRPMKVGREAMVGIYAAVKHFLNGGAEVTQQMAQVIAGELAGVPGLVIRIDEPGSHVHVQWSLSRFSLTRDEIKARLLAEEPRILVRDSGPHGIRVNAGTLSEGQEQIVARRLKELLLAASPRSATADTSRCGHPRCRSSSFTLSRRAAMSLAEPAVRRWTVDEYHRAAEMGIFGPEERLELVNGKIFRMSPQNGPHATGSTLAEGAVQEVFRAGYGVRIQKPLALGGDSEPEPDIAVVRGKARDYLKAHPAMAELVVEVADSSLQFDRVEKAEIYARAGIPEYWILNVPDRMLEVYRDPEPAAGEYRSMTRYDGNDTVSPLAAPNARIGVRDLLP